jgi:acetyl-CoA C-acetyltransferase
MATGIKDKVAIIGMGCTQFGERWDVGTPQLLAEAFDEALNDAGIERGQIDAAWCGSALDSVNVGNSAIPASIALRLDGIPVSRMENMCATGTEVLRGAAYAVASGAVDIALAIGAEKLKDTGYGGLPTPYKGTLNDLWMPLVSAPAGFAQLAAGYGSKHRIPKELLKRAIAHVSWKSHQNGALSPKAHLRKPVTMEQILNAPLIAEPLGLFDCCGVSDGAAAAIVTTPEIARALGKKDLVTIKALQLSISSGVESTTRGWDGSYVPNTRAAAKRAPRTLPDGSARLLFNNRTGDDGRFVRQWGWPCCWRSSRRIFRPRRHRGAMPGGWRPEMFRTPDRRQRPAHGVRNLFTASGPRRRATAA